MVVVVGEEVVGWWWLVAGLVVVGGVVPLVAGAWGLLYWLFHERRFDYDAGSRKRSLDQLCGSNLLVRSKVVVIGTMPGTPRDERFAWRLAQALGVPYFELSNVNMVFLPSGGGDDDHDDPSFRQNEDTTTTTEQHSNAREAVDDGDGVHRWPARWSGDWRREAEAKRDIPRRVGSLVRRFFSKNKYNGYVIDMILDRWETYDPLFEEARDIVWVELGLGTLLLQLLRRIVDVRLLRSSKLMFDEDAQWTGGKRPFTDYWYRWSNLVRFWDENRSLLAKTVSVYYKNLQTAPFLLDHNGQLECWHMRSLAQLETFLCAVRAEKKKSS